MEREQVCAGDSLSLNPWSYLVQKVAFLGDTDRVSWLSNYGAFCKLYVLEPQCVYYGGNVGLR